jgi:TRAP transporter 4TM/12TM fusion protein
VNGEPQQPEAAEQSSAASPAVALATDILQGALIFCVVSWVLDLPRRLFDMSFYTEQLLAVCLGLGLALSFITTSTAIGSRIRIMRWLDWFAAVASLIICGYIAYRYDALTYEIALLPIDGVIGSAILLLLVLEATRRTSGGVLVVIILILTLYVFIGPHMPGDFATRPVSSARLITYLGLDTNGMIGIILSVALLIVVPFTLMGQVLGRTGGANYFADLAMSAMGRFRGGAAKIAVFGSALFGMISGAAVSNVVAVGIVTIPLMSRSGFSPVRAAAIESVGSTGGQLMPPVMGAAAFIMAEFLQVSYGAVCIAAVIPSLLYYAALFMHVDLEAAKNKIGAAQVADPPKFAEVLKSGWHFPIPLIFLIVTIVYPEIFQIPIERAAVYATAILIVLSMIFGYRGTRVTPRQMIRAILDTGRASLDIVLIGAAAGLVVGTLSVSGISFGLTLQLIALSGGSLFMLLILTAIISIILGMGMPTVSVYVLTATLLAPSLIKLGVTPMAAHMYVMYFGMLSMITPPVAIAAYAAANIARVSGWTTGWTAVVVGWSTFFIPFLFVLEPSLLMEGSPGLIAWNFARNILGIFVGTAGIVGFAFGLLALPMRMAFGAAALAILIPQHAFPGADVLDWIGLGSAITVLAVNYLQSRLAKQTAAPEVARP